MRLKPADEAELAEAVAGATGPLRIEGGGTRRGLGHAVEGEALETGGVSGITLYEPGALTLVARAGTPLAEIETVLEAEGQMLPFEPMDHRGIFGTNGASTIGGVVACNASGPRRIQAGACRDSLIGVRFVDGEGTVLKNGGRVMKNVTGYDLVKLICGSHGTLGVLSEVSFKVLPRAETVTTVTVHGLAAEDAVQAMSAALGSPFDVTGAAHVPGGDTFLRVEGFESSVRYRAARLMGLLQRFGDVSMLEDGAVWADIRDAAQVRGPGDIWRVSVKPTDGAAVLAAIRHEAALLDWGGGLVWLRVAEGADVRAALAGMQGHATLVNAAEKIKSVMGVFQPEPKMLGAISAGLRKKFDPKGILNPGRMG